MASTVAVAALFAVVGGSFVVGLVVGLNVGRDEGFREFRGRALRHAANPAALARWLLLVRRFDDAETEVRRGYDDEAKSPRACEHRRCEAGDGRAVCLDCGADPSVADDGCTGDVPTCGCGDCGAIRARVIAVEVGRG